MKKNIILFSLFLILTSFYFISCNNNEFTIGQDYLSSDVRIAVVDTCTVNLSTIRMMDSVVTSNKGIALVGRFDDKDFGKYTATSYFGFLKPDNSNLTNSDYYDSLSLIIYYNKYYYGDTNQYQNISVFRLNENIVLNDTALYNNSSFTYDPAPIATIYFRPTWRKQRVSIRLPDDLGKDIFNKILNQSIAVTDEASFEKYFKGLVLVTDKSKSSNIAGFIVNDTSVVIRLYYDLANVSRGLNSLDISVNTSLQFNQINQEKVSSSYLDLEKFSKKNNDELSSEVTGNQSYIQGIMGFDVELDIPHLDNFLLTSDYIGISQAILYIPPVFGTYPSSTPLPASLSVLMIDQFSNVSSYSTATLVTDYVNNQNTYYEFDISGYLRNQLGAFPINKKKLLLTLSNSDFNTTLKRVVLADQNNPKNRLKVQLKLLFYNANSN